MTRDGDTYVVIWASGAQSALRRLPEKVAAAAVEFIYGPLAENPHRVGHALRFKLEGLHSARRGGHRIVYRIDQDAREVLILAMAHRSDVYRRKA